MTGVASAWQAEQKGSERRSGCGACRGNLLLRPGLAEVELARRRRELGIVNVHFPEIDAGLDIVARTDCRNVRHDAVN